MLWLHMYLLLLQLYNNLVMMSWCLVLTRAAEDDGDGCCGSGQVPQSARTGAAGVSHRYEMQADVMQHLS
jgi:hypothetical protein